MRSTSEASALVPFTKTPQVLTGLQGFFYVKDEANLSDGEIRVNRYLSRAIKIIVGGIIFIEQSNDEKNHQNE